MAEIFRSDPQLRQFILSNIEPTREQIGTGSYGSVEKVILNETFCAAKKLHDALIDRNNEGYQRIVHKYRQECQLMSRLNHPNITKFFGIWFISDVRLPLLVMELLDTSLAKYLDTNDHLPLATKVSILTDVACGLEYLHGREPQPVIHRDLTANNVLLKSTPQLVAKISDVGNSHIIDHANNKTLTIVPGTLVYMPPEATEEQHEYDQSLDIFSFGHLALYTLIQQSPHELLPPTYFHQGIKARSEIERRGRYVAEMERLLTDTDNHFLVQIVKQCLDNNPRERPKADTILHQLQGKHCEAMSLGMARYNVHTDGLKVKEKEVSFPLQLHWDCCPDMPFEMDLYIQSVLIQGKIYVGGGLHKAGNHLKNSTIMVYDIQSEKWSQLPPYHQNIGGFAMVAIKNQLVLVGGSSPRSRVNFLGVWIGQWTHPYPKMQVCRTRCSAVVHKKWLIVAGGRLETLLSSIEIMDTNTKTWFNNLPPLPTAWVDMKIAIVGETCYFMGGCIDQNGPVATNKIFSVHLEALISQLHSVRARGGVWNEFPGFFRSTPLSLGGWLLALGGRIKDNRAVTKIHRYLPLSNKWEEVGNLSVPRFNCACALISHDNKILVFGGYSDSRETKKVEMAVIC